MPETENKLFDQSPVYYQSGQSDQVIDIIKDLAKNEGFSDIAIFLTSYFSRDSVTALQQQFILNKLPSIILNNYLYQRSPLEPSTVLKKLAEITDWEKSIELSATNEERLKLVVLSIVERLQTT